MYICGDEVVFAVEKVSVWFATTLLTATEGDHDIGVLEL